MLLLCYFILYSHFLLTFLCFFFTLKESQITSKLFVKVTAKKGTKKVSKTLTAKASVINAGLRFVDAPAEVVVGSETTLNAKKSPKAANVTFASSDDAVATVDAATGAVKAVKAGKVTITATSDYGKSVATDIVVKKAIVKSAEQTEFNKIEAVIVGDTKDIKAGDIKVTNTATKATVAVKSVAAKKGAENTFVIETFTGMTDAKDYTVEYAESVAAFTATDGTVDKVALTKTEVPAGIKTEVQAVTKDAKGVILKYYSLTNGSNAKGEVTTALTITKGYVQGTDVYLPAVGDTMVAKLTYHTGSYATDGTETGIKEDTFTITAVDPSTVTYNYAVTIAGSKPTWTATSFKATTAIKVGDASKFAFIRITDENGKEIDTTSYAGYTVETADPSKLVVKATALSKTSTTDTCSDGVDIKGVAAGDTYILVKKDGKVVYSIPVSVQGKATATTVDLNKSSVTVMSGKAVAETIEAKLKDQYSEDMTIKTATVEPLAWPTDATKTNADVLTATGATTKKATVSVMGNQYSVKGTYTYKITLKDNDNKAIVRTFTVNVVDVAAAQAYQLSLPTEVDTTVGKDTAQSNIDVTAQVIETANGATVGNYSGVNNISYTVKDATGKDVDDALLTNKTGSTSALKVKVVSNSGAQFEKTLAAGTYYVTATFTTGSGATAKDVAVSGSFKIKDTQDSAAKIDVKDNKLDTTIKSALTMKAKVVVTYDGQEQTISSSDIKDVDATIAGNTAFVKSIKVFVSLTDSASGNKVLVTIPVNQTFTNVTGL